MMTKLPEALKEFAKYKQFILWTTATRNGKLVKLPVSYKTGQVADAHDPDCWTSADEIFIASQMWGDNYNVGFAFTKYDPFYFLDLDKCLQADNTWTPLALDLIARLPGAAVEISQSGKGLHIFGTGLSSDHGCKNIAEGLELYTEGRFVALTGTNIQGDAATNNSATGQHIIDQYFAPKATTRGTEWKNEPDPKWNGPTDDDKLIELMINSESTAAKFGTKASPRQLWEGDPVALAEFFPDPEGQRDHDGSSADAALAQHCAYWTGCNHQRIHGLMLRSGLVRDKYERDDYLTRTITRAVSLQDKVYSTGDASKCPIKLKGSEKQKAFAAAIIEKHGDDPRILLLTGPALTAKFWIDNQDKTIDQIITATKPIESAKVTTRKVMRIKEGYQFLGITQQIEYFAGCIYVQDVDRILTPHGALCRPSQFNAIYGGYTFQMEADAGGKTKEKAWEVFTESQAVEFPQADSMCFKPDLPHGEIIEHEGRSLVNTYLDVKTPSIAGNVDPFLNHLAKVLPNERDRAILLAYMAACNQHKGVKFQWAPLIQGAEGNGKTLFTRCVAAGIGKRYMHWPKASDLDNKFNGWLMGKLFIGVEDIYVPSQRREIIEALKPMITGGDGLEIQMKGVDQISADVCCNFMFNSNHKDAIETTRNDRRFATFYTAQQSVDDINRDGMGGDYFPKLYNWLKREDGYAIVSHYLKNYDIPDELNPATSCHRAPATSSTEAAINASMGDAEIIINDAIDNNVRGFCGGVVWTKSAIELLRENGKNIHTRALSRVLENIGYMKHAAADSSGRIKIHGERKRFYVKREHPVSLIKTTDDLRAELIKICGGSKGRVGADVRAFPAPAQT